MVRPHAFVASAALLLAAPASAQDRIAAGTPIEQGLGVDLTEAGFNTILEQLVGFIPPDLVIGSIPSQELVDIFFCQQNFWLENLVVHTQLDSATVEGYDDRMEAVIRLDLWINDPADPAVVHLDGCLDYVCFLHTDPAQLEIRLPITLALATDINNEPFVDFTFGALSHNIDTALDGAVHLTDCAVGDINEFLDQYLGINLFDLVIDQVAGSLESQIGEQLAEIEITAEDALRAAWLQDSIDALGAELQYDLHPTTIDHVEGGLRLIMGGSVSADPAPCVASLADDGSLWTGSSIPDFSEVVPATQTGYHLGARLSDDFVNQGLYAAWRGGVLCYSLADLGGPLTTTYLGLLLGTESAKALEEIFFLGDVPMLIRIVPSEPPVARFDGDHHLTVDAMGLGVEFYPLMQDRLTRLASVAIDVHAGVDLYVDETDALAMDIAIDTDNLNPRVIYNEIAPELNPAFEQNFPNFLGVVLDTVAGSALEGVAFALPTFQGIGLTQLDIYPEGSLLDWLALYATLGPSTGGEGSGCDSCGGAGGCAEGCGAEGCGGDQGCDAETLISESGCSGTATDQPSDTGCTGCKLHGSGRRGADGQWRFEWHQGGAHRTHRSASGGHLLLALLVPIVLRRRRR